MRASNACGRRIGPSIVPHLARRATTASRHRVHDTTRALSSAFLRVTGLSSCHDVSRDFQRQRIHRNRQRLRRRRRWRPGGRIALGGGAGVLVTIVALLFGLNPGDIMGGAVDRRTTRPWCPRSTSTFSPAHTRKPTATPSAASRPRRSASTGCGPTCSRVTPSRKTVIFDTVNTACGAASSSTGPFYCPADKTAYFDPTFFDMLVKMGGSDGPLADVRRGPRVRPSRAEPDRFPAEGQQDGLTRATSGLVRIELQADCYAGVWAYHADKGDDALLKPLTSDQIASAIQTARAIGDDTIQGSNSNPESWTHGSSKQRVKWFSTGYKSGDPNSCDTFSASDLG